MKHIFCVYFLFVCSKYRSFVVQWCITDIHSPQTTHTGVKCLPGLDPDSLDSTPPTSPLTRDVTPLTDWRLEGV